MKKIVLFFTLIFMVFALVACGNDTSKDNDSGVITDLDISEVSEPQYINQLEFTAGETIENPYYKRTANDTGESMYMVERADNGEPVYMPVTETVIYTSNDDAVYYQEITMTYKQDGEPMEKKQYQIYISVPEENEEYQEDLSTDNDTIKVLPGNDEDFSVDVQPQVVM